jgi:hypothetical protein
MKHTNSLPDIQILNDIANELKRTAEIYHKAATHVNESVVAEELESVASTRERFLEQLLDEANKHGKEELEISSNPDLQRQVELILGNLLVTQNVPRVLKACSASDDQLTKEYAKHLEHEQMRDETRILLNEQYNNVLELQRSLEKRIEKYPWFSG